MRVAAILAGVLLFVAGLVAFPYVYNYHVAPLARLSKRVRIGDSCAATAETFAAYAARYRRVGNTDLQYSDGTTEAAIGFDHYAPPRRLLHLYDLALMDDVQLTAVCDAAGAKVEWVGYIGD